MPTAAERRTKKRPFDNPEANGATAPPRVNSQAEPQPKRESVPPTTTFWEFLFNLGERWQTQDIALYVYRLWPVTDQRNSERFLCKLHEPIDEDYLLKNFGSGKYWLLVNDAHGKNLRKHVVNPHNPEFPPKVSPLEVVESDPQNKLYFEVWANPQKSNAGTAAGRESGKGETAEILNAVFERGTKVDPTLVDLWKDTAKQRDEMAKLLSAKEPSSMQNSPAGLAELLKTLKDFMPAQGKESRGSETSEMLAVIAALKEMQPLPQDPLAILQQAKALFAPADSAPRGRDEIARLDQILGFAQKLASLRGGNAGDRSGWDVGLDYARELGTPLMQLAQTWMLSRTGRVPPAGANAAPAPPQAFDPYGNPQAMREHARRANQAANGPTQQQSAPGAPPPPNANAGNPQTAPPSDELAPLLQNYGALLVNALNAGERGCDLRTISRRYSATPRTR